MNILAPVRKFSPFDQALAWIRKRSTRGRRLGWVGRKASGELFLEVVHLDVFEWGGVERVPAVSHTKMVSLKVIAFLTTVTLF